MRNLPFNLQRDIPAKILETLNTINVPGRPNFKDVVNILNKVNISEDKKSYNSFVMSTCSLKMIIAAINPSTP